MSPVPWNCAGAPVCALLGGTGLAHMPAKQPVALPMLLRAWYRPPVNLASDAVARVPRARGY